MAPATTSVATSHDARVSRITKAAPRLIDEISKSKKKGYAGTYRMIHGSVVLPRPWDEWHTASGKVRMGAPRTMTATIYPSKIAQADDKEAGIKAGDVVEYIGDEVYLNDEDAWRLLGMEHPADKREHHAMVERLDAVPSRCGKVWQPLKRQSTQAG